MGVIYVSILQFWPMSTVMVTVQGLARAQKGTLIVNENGQKTFANNKAVGPMTNLTHFPKMERGTGEVKQMSSEHLWPTSSDYGGVKPLPEVEMIDK